MTDIADQPTTTRRNRWLWALPVAALALAGGAFTLATRSHAALKTGVKAPQIVTQGAMAGKAFNYDLYRALKNGPVVLYFFPKVFTKGCTIETHAFAEAHDDFAAAGASVIGMSADGIEDLKKFSVEACRSKFPVAHANKATIKAYNVSLGIPGKKMTNRTSYVIAQDGTIALVHSDMNPNDHITKTLAAVKAMKK